VFGGPREARDDITIIDNSLLFLPIIDFLIKYFLSSVKMASVFRWGGLKIDKLSCCREMVGNLKILSYQATGAGHTKSRLVTGGAHAIWHGFTIYILLIEF